ncbi:MAG: translation initiation factor IF-2 subunit gamma, partial [Thermoplasmata archaeon]|nr:translation initiation factor IF-2 subunit gamma [Thermoplasmata archaeon]
QIQEFIKGTIAETAPIIPISAHHDVNIDMLIEAIEKKIPTPKWDKTKPARMYVARSFDVNNPGTKIENLKGGVVGGSMTQGKLKVGDEVEIAPGRRVEVGSKTSWESVVTEVRSLYAGGLALETAHPGGLIAIGTGLDPSYTKSDSLVGRIAGAPGTLPPIANELTFKTQLMNRVVGVSSELAVDNLKTNEPLMLSIGTATTVGVVTSGRSDSAEVSLKIPVCVEKSQRIAISRRIAGKWRLIGYGVVE